jgi:hypothetical protein
MAGAFYTREELITETLANLGVLAPGQSIAPEDHAYVSEKLDAIFRKLAGLRVCYVPDPDNIPGVWFSDLADIVAGECCTKFGVTPDDYIKLINKGLGGVQGIDVGQGAAAKSLRHINRGRPTYEVLRTEYL